MSTLRQIDGDLDSVFAGLKELDPDGSRTASVLRSTLDQLYDGQRTGRYKREQLFKTEKTHCGTLVEINLQREFKFQDGDKLDYRIAGVEVDCKYSWSGSWMIPPEARGHICLVVSAEDTASPKWSMGLVRITDDRLNDGSNRDAKSTLNEDGRNAIMWLFQDSSLPPNVLLQLDEATVKRIFSHTTSGQKRINELFRLALCRRIGRAVVATVGQQDDYMKRVRENRGARSALRPEGILILGQYQSHVQVAQALDIPVPGPGESVSVRVVLAKEGGQGVAQIGGQFWQVAKPEDPVIAAPFLPEI